MYGQVLPIPRVTAMQRIKGCGVMLMINSSLSPPKIYLCVQVNYYSMLNGDTSTSGWCVHVLSVLCHNH